MSRVPAHPEEIDAAWLTAALAERHPGAVVDRVELLECHETTNSHAKIAAVYREAAGAPSTFFCKMLPNHPEARQAIAATRMGLYEALFYRHLAPQLDLLVPGVHVVVLDEAAGSFALLMEDLAARGCTVSDGVACVAPDAAARALEELAGLHLRFRDPARRAADAAWVQEPGPPSDYGTSRLQYGLEHHRDRLGKAFAELAELYVTRCAALHELWHRGPRTVIHGDPHIGNLFDSAGRVGFLDWGLINASTPMRDVSYFLTMSLSVEDRRSHEVGLLRHYLEHWNAGGGDAISFDEAWLAHRVHAAYTVPASCQIVTFPKKLSPRRRLFSEAFLSRAEAAVEDLEVRAALREAAGI